MCILNTYIQSTYIDYTHNHTCMYYVHVVLVIVLVTKTTLIYMYTYM